MWGKHGSCERTTLRYGRAPEDAPPAKSAFVESIRSKWFKLHWILNAVGLSFAALGAVFSYSAGVVQVASCTRSTRELSSSKDSGFKSLRG